MVILYVFIVLFILDLVVKSILIYEDRYLEVLRIVEIVMNILIKILLGVFIYSFI